MREKSLSVALPEKWGEGLVCVAAGETIELEVRLESVHEGILVSAELETTATGECGRCLDPVSLPLQVEFQELFAYHSDEACEYEVQEDHVNLEQLIRDAVVLALPFQPVCRPDCPGLDPQTGVKLAGASELTPTAVRDPRWDALTKFAASGEADGLGAE